jgi:hypothetical protein
MKKTILFVIVTTFLLAACSALPKSNAPVPDPKTTSDQPQATSKQPTAPANLQPAPSLSADEVYQAVSAAWTKLDTAGPRHISQTTSEGLTTEADVIPPDFHQVMSAGGNVVAEQYIVGGTIYNNAQGAWTQTTGGGAALNTIGNFALNLSDSLVYSDGMVNGVEVINGSPAIVYSYSTTLKGLDASAQYKLWVDQASGLPVRSVNITPDGMTTDETITYDNSITITLPGEAKNAPAPTE